MSTNTRLAFELEARIRKAGGMNAMRDLVGDSEEYQAALDCVDAVVWVLPELVRRLPLIEQVRLRYGEPLAHTISEAGEWVCRVGAKKWSARTEGGACTKALRAWEPTEAIYLEMP